MSPLSPAPIIAPDAALDATSNTALDAAIARAVMNLASLQNERGSWSGDYGGPMFLLPMYVALCHAAGRVPSGARRDGMVTYYFNVQRADGSIGLHAEATAGSMFCTALGYVALRMLGVSADDARMDRMRAWIWANGTPLGSATWGKFMLCVLGLYDWRGIHPILPELWLLPRSAPLHPSRMWCHARQVYLPMAWLYGKRSTVPRDAFIDALRAELYGGTWDTIDWRAARDTVAPADAYRPNTRLLAATNAAANALERIAPSALRQRALAECLRHIQYEDAVTNDLDIGPVNAVLNTLVHWFRGADGRADFDRGFAALEPYIWEGHDGTKMQGYNNSELWDTAFTIQALCATPPSAQAAAVLSQAYDFLRDNQILGDVPDAEAHYRHRSKGGWPFSNRAHGWPITDCTAEGLKCALALNDQIESAQRIPVARLHDAVDQILSWQNADGGWATYEPQRGGAWLESLNPSQVFGDIMVDYSYVECTSACIGALTQARQRFGATAALDGAIARGAQFLRTAQRADGSFEGSWAVCFTYGTWFGINGLRAAGAAATDPAIRRACAFLLSKQRPDGSWSEHGDTARARAWIEGATGHVAQTSWALLALLAADEPETTALARAADFLVSRQQPTADGAGTWPREAMVGVFNRTCLINYDNYRHYFPLWALATYRSKRT